MSVLYGSIFYSYFLLEIIGLWAGIGLSVLVTLSAVLLSLRYESRTICSMGLVGGLSAALLLYWSLRAGGQCGVCGDGVSVRAEPADSADLSAQALGGGQLYQLPVQHAVYPAADLSGG
ncbi:hypothetical protein ACFTAO_45385 [Paenibacillus rhizoplanae]